DMAAKANFQSGGEECVVGNSIDSPLAGLDMRVQELSTYYRLYAEEWRKFLVSYNVIPYKSMADAAHKLDTLAGSASPLLGIVKLVAKNTNFPPPKPGDRGILGKVGDLIPGKSQAEQAQQFLQGKLQLMTEADLNRRFEPVLWTTPPEL